MVKDERLKYIRIMRNLNITMLFTYMLMYITYLGAYDAVKYAQEMESSIFVWERTSVAVVVGEIFSLSVITYLVLRITERMKAAVPTLILGIMKLLLIWAPYMLICSLGIGHEFIGWIAGISRLVYTYDALGVMGNYFPRYMVGLGIVLFVVATIQELMTIVVAAYQIVICKKKKIKNYDDYDIVEQDTYVEGNRKLRMVMKILNIVFCIIMIICLTIVSLGTLTMAMAYTLPLALLLLVFCCRWIKRGKWLYVVGSYIISAYTIYAGLMYVLSGFPKALQMFNQTGEIIVSGSIVLAFAVMTVIVSICGVVDEMYAKKNKVNSTR